MHRHAGSDAGADPHACGADPGAVLARGEALCRERGLQFTPLRREVLEAVAAAERPQGAYDVAERLSRPGRRVAPVSVYRALDFLMEQGLVHRIASRNAFIPCAHAHGPGEGVVFLICRTCGGVDETSSREVERGLGRTLERAGFRPSHSILEVEGDCGACLERERAG
ncbi:Fur family transcriptional regulator [Methylobacterium sp. NEAU 140]|uniref:Fur family transcriptional regulator n=1 Tax=Methylobacterium sp. NEAU 140 TaxID=3064945 RepID=UPI0027333498|nr:Fur family transcriptional regulator [Methylobacterium sp. NEAU 140]MDP4022163.1 Fur family transcriptional regulator [Methylobacterium sp. NEAU 140]